MPTSSATLARQLHVEPSQVIVPRLAGANEVLAAFRIHASSVRATEWFVVSPRQALHPDYQPDHWLGDLDAAAAPSEPRELPTAVALPIDTRRLDPNRRYQALAYVVLRLPDDEALIARVPITVLPVGLTPPSAPDRQPTAGPTVQASSGRPALASVSTRPRPIAAPSVRAAPAPRPVVNPFRPATDTREAFCGRCGRRFTAQEKFCPKDGRKRQVRSR